MNFLSVQEIGQFQQILINKTLLQSSDSNSRSDLLTNCGLGKYSGLIPLDKPLVQFVNSLCAKLSSVYVTIDGSERLGLVVFLEYISYIDPGLSSEDQAFIQHVISKWEKWHASDTQRQQPEKLSSFSSPEQPALQTFEFDVATVEVVKQSELFGGIQVTSSCRRHEAKYFSEDLGNEVVLEMVAIPGSSFTMGSPDKEETHQKHESPQHGVRVTPFFMGKYPVTQIQWQTVATLPPVKRDLDPNPSGFKGANRPVECVSWDEAVEFCARLSQKTGRKYRLPSEAEWEYACRGGTSTPFHFGETITPKLANYNGKFTYGSGPKGRYRTETTHVGSFEVANNFGLYDMHGNVWEWCADGWHDSYEGAPSDGSAWLNDNDKYQLVRGGSWLSPPQDCRSAYRDRYQPGYRSFILGFRVVFAPVRTL